MATTVTVAHKVRDYDAWRTAFDGHDAGRKEHGLSVEGVYRGAEDPNRILVALEAPTREAVLAFASDPSLKAVMEEGGVISEPTVVIGEILAPQPA